MDKVLRNEDVELLLVLDISRREVKEIEVDVELNVYFDRCSLFIK